ncbi:MAG: YceI family protein [Hellea sp.]|nr:YceI family protein [Hellea sp.]
MFRTMILTAVLAAGVTMSACSGGDSGPAELAGDWTLNTDESGLTYITIKLDDIAEINTFRDISGTVTSEGNASIIINLNSVDTANEIRDPRMKQYLFETEKYPVAKADATLDMSAFESLKTGDRHTELLNLQLDLHGVKAQMDYYVSVTRLGPNKVLVENKAPLILDARDFGMDAGLAKLQELAGLDSITPVVPITVSLVFERLGK